MYELKKIGKVFTSKFVGTGSSSYKKGIYRAAVWQRLRNTVLEYPCNPYHAQHVLPEQRLKRFVNAYYGSVSTYHKKRKWRMPNLQTSNSELVSAVCRLNLLTTNMSYLRITYFLRHAAFNKSVSAFFLPSEFSFIYVYSHYTHLHSAGCLEPFPLTVWCDALKCQIAT